MKGREIFMADNTIFKKAKKPKEELGLIEKVIIYLCAKRDLRQNNLKKTTINDEETYESKFLRREKRRFEAERRHLEKRVIVEYKD